MKKKILGLALALVMIISLLPLTAMAEDAAKVLYENKKTWEDRCSNKK